MRPGSPSTFPDRHGSAPFVVVSDTDALCLGDQAAGRAQLVLEVEALRAEAAGSDADLDLVLEAERRAEVDLDPGDDDREVVEARAVPCSSMNATRADSR